MQYKLQLCFKVIANHLTGPYSETSPYTALKQTKLLSQNLPGPCEAVPNQFVLLQHQLLHHSHRPLLELAPERLPYRLDCTWGN